MNRKDIKIRYINILRYVLAVHLLLGLALPWNASAAIATDPNRTMSDPNALFAKPAANRHVDPNTDATSIVGTLALKWLYQDTTSTIATVNQNNVSFHTEVYPWPYFPYTADMTVPWYCRPRNESDHWITTGKEFTYPMRRAEVQIMLDTQTSLSFGSYFFSDPLNEY